MKSPASLRTAPIFVVFSAFVVVMVMGATALLPSARAEEALDPEAVLPPEAFLLASSETEPLSPSSSSSPTTQARADGADATAGESAKGDGDLERAEEDLRSIFDPTVIRRRVGIENELIDQEDSAWTNRTEFSGVFAIGPAKDFDLALGLVVPVVYFASEEPPGRQDNFGLGDLELTTAVAFRHTPWFSQALALEVKFNTATDDTLGEDATILKPFYVASIRPLSYLGTVIEIDYNDSVSEESGVAKTRNLELNPSVNLTYPDGLVVVPQGAVQREGRLRERRRVHEPYGGLRR